MSIDRSPLHRPDTVCGLSLLYKTMFNRIRIGIKEARAALSDKRRLDAFCLCLKVKFLFRSSDLKFRSYNQAAKVLHIDNNKLKQLLVFGEEYGYFRKETDSLGNVRYIANKIHNNKEYSYRTRDDDTKKCTFPELKALVRRAVLENHVAIIGDCANTHRRASDGDSVKQIRSNQKRERRMLSKEYNERYIGLSYDKITKVINGSTYQAYKAVKNLSARCILQKSHRCEFLNNVAPAACAYNRAYSDAYGNQIVICPKNRVAMLVRSNTYSICGRQAISKSNNGSNISK